jgi:predicted GIY-YIG superfamily endonuclease
MCYYVAINNSKVGAVYPKATKEDPKKREKTHNNGKKSQAQGRHCSNF